VKEHDIRNQAFFDLGEDIIEWDFQSPDNDQSALQIAKEHQRNLSIRNPAYASIDIEIFRILKEYKAVYNVETGFFKGGAWISTTEKQDYTFLASDYDTAMQFAKNHKVEIKTPIPINSSIRLEEVVEVGSKESDFKDIKNLN